MHIRTLILKLKKTIFQKQHYFFVKTKKINIYLTYINISHFLKTFQIIYNFNLYEKF